MPARESQLKEPPFPKSKKLESNTKDNMYIDIEDWDPIWLKDKGDHFFKWHDFYAAQNAYSKAISNDKEFHKAFLNRATTFLKIW